MQALAWSIVALMLLVVLISACLRLTQPHPPCESWPECRGAVVDVVPAHAEDVKSTRQERDLARLVHRAAASTTLLLVIALVGLSLRRPRDRRMVNPALALLAFALGLAALGIVTAGSRSLLVLLGNLLGGYAMLALAWRLTRGRRLEAAAAHELERRARVASTLWILQVMAGAISGSGQSTLAPFAHLALALPTFLWVLMLARHTRRIGLRAEGGALLLLVIAQPILGGIAAWSGAPPQAVALHSFSAALALALLVGLRDRGMEHA